MQHKEIFRSRIFISLKNFRDFVSNIIQMNKKQQAVYF